MKIKVCGLQIENQVNELDEMESIDFLGFIFYSNSKRFIGEEIPRVNEKKKVGVFVNESIETIEQICLQNGIQTIQLHGDESPEMCALLSKKYSVIKAIGIIDSNSFNGIERYEAFIDLFLFDTKTSEYGGSGKSFDWSILSSYKLETPFFLSGGIHPNTVEKLKEIKHPKMIGIDINSGFERSPGDKDVRMIEQFTKKIKNEYSH